MGSDTWYRFEDHRVAPPVDEYDNPIGSSTLEVNLRTFTLLRRTPKGVWLTSSYGGPRFVLNGATKCYACPTVEAALESFTARKNKQARILRRRADDADDAVYEAQRRASRAGVKSLVAQGSVLLPPVRSLLS